jgi:hypothetical protein
MAMTRPSTLPPGPPSRTALYRGPLLLTYDPRLNDYKPCPASLHATDFVTPKLLPPPPNGSWLSSKMVLEFTCQSRNIEAERERSKVVRLCDFGSAGLSGRDYSSWLPLAFPASALPTAPFSQKRPTRTFVLEQHTCLPTDVPEIRQQPLSVKLRVLDMGGATIRRFAVQRGETPDACIALLDCAMSSVLGVKRGSLCPTLADGHELGCLSMCEWRGATLRLAVVTHDDDDCTRTGD